LLPHDIAVLACEDVHDGFHARYDTIAKEYVYVIRNASVRDVFTQGMVYFYPHTLDTEAMRGAAALFVGEHDFSAYCKAESLELTKQKKRGTIRKIYSVQLSTVNCQLSTAITGDGFLHNMVRIIAGTLLYVGEGKLSLEDVQKSLSGEKRETAGKTLPACGLYLNKVYYNMGGSTVRTV
jgi:tRNA pseudouridine38-40 synthase